MPSSSPSSAGLYVPIHKRAGSNTSLSSQHTPNPYMYSAATLLSLQPFADESVKGKILATCPEVVMTRKIRKRLEVNGRRTEVLGAQQQMQVSGTPETKVTPILQTSTPAPLRVLPRRYRPSGRAPERRRNVFSSPSQVFGSRRGLSKGDDSWRLHAMPSPVLLL